MSVYQLNYNNICRNVLTRAFHAFFITFNALSRLHRSRFLSRLGTIVHWPWASHLHLCASVTKQYNITWYRSTGGDALRLGRWPCVTDVAVYPPTGSRPRKGDKHLPPNG